MRVLAVLAVTGCALDPTTEPPPHVTVASLAHTAVDIQPVTDARGHGLIIEFEQPMVAKECPVLESMGAKLGALVGLPWDTGSQVNDYDGKPICTASVRFDLGKDEEAPAGDVVLSDMTGTSSLPYVPYTPGDVTLVGGLVSAQTAVAHITPAEYTAAPLYGLPWVHCIEAPSGPSLFSAELAIDGPTLSFDVPPTSYRGKVWCEYDLHLRKVQTCDGVASCTITYMPGPFADWSELRGYPGMLDIDR